MWSSRVGPSERWGQEVVAIVALVDGASADAQELIDHAAGSIARYKLPKAIVFRPVIERSPAGKADYRWAREQAISGLDAESATGCVPVSSAR